MIHKVTIYKDIITEHNRGFFSNKKDAIKWGKSREKVLDLGLSGIEEYTYKLESIPTPKTKKEWIRFINIHGSVGN